MEDYIEFNSVLISFVTIAIIVLLKRYLADKGRVPKCPKCQSTMVTRIAGRGGLKVNPFGGVVSITRQVAPASERSKVGK